MTSPLSPEAVAQTANILRGYSTAPMWRFLRQVADILATLAAENATLRAERDDARKASDRWASEAVPLRASEAAALGALAEIGVAVAALEGADSLDKEIIRNIGTRIAALTPTADKEPK